MTFSIMNLIAILGINDIQHKNTQHNELNCDTQNNELNLDTQHNNVQQN
jgi:hypothetical protein